MARRTDQIVAQAPTVPAVQFANPEAAETVVAPIRAQYEQMSMYSAQQTVLATQKAEEIDALRRQIDRLDLERHQCEMYAKQAREVADGAAKTLALLGFPVPPQSGELSQDPDGSLDRFNAAHDALGADGGRS